MALLFVPVVGVSIGTIFKVLWQIVIPLIFAIIAFNLLNITILYEKYFSYRRSGLYR